MHTKHTSVSPSLFTQRAISQLPRPNNDPPSPFGISPTTPSPTIYLQFNSLDISSSISSSIGTSSSILDILTNFRTSALAPTRPSMIIFQFWTSSAFSDRLPPIHHNSSSILDILNILRLSSLAPHTPRLYYFDFHFNIPYTHHHVGQGFYSFLETFPLSRDSNRDTCDMMRHYFTPSLLSLCIGVHRLRLLLGVVRRILESLLALLFFRLHSSGFANPNPFVCTSNLSKNQRGTKLNQVKGNTQKKSGSPSYWNYSFSLCNL